MEKTAAISHFKTQSAIARALTNAGYPITQPAVSKWGAMVPEIPARLLAEISGGRLVFDEAAYRNYTECREAAEQGREVATCGDSAA